MRTSIEGLMAIVSHEAIVLTPYKDSVGVPTIGIGHTAAAGWPDPKTYTGSLTVSEAFNMLRTDIKKYEDGVNKAVKVPLKQHEFDALVSFNYNTGAIGKASFVKKLNAGDRAGAIKGIMAYRKPAEIIPRREAERDLFAKGAYPAPFATIFPATKAGKIQWSKGNKVDLRDHLKPGGAEPAPAPAKPALKITADQKSSVMHRGSKGDYVTELQNNLVTLGYGPLVIDGAFGDATEKAVKKLQTASGLKADGWAGPRTLEAIGKALKDRELQPVIEEAEKHVPAEAKKEVEKKSNWWTGITGGLAGVGTGITALTGLDWRVAVAIGVTGIVAMVLLIVMRQQIIAAFKDINSEAAKG